MTPTAPEPHPTLTLVEEIQTYLAVVEAFRALGAPPSWAREAPAAEWPAERGAHARPGEHRVPSPGRDGG